MSLVELEGVSRLSAPAAPSLDQLCFGPIQPPLEELEEPARQLALLPEPEPWELDLGPSPLASPEASRTASQPAIQGPAQGLSEGQQSLF